MRAICLCCLAGILALTHVRAEGRVINGINVVVNDAVITYQEVEGSIAHLIETLAAQYRTNPQLFEQKLQELRARQVEELVQRQLILHEYHSAGYALPESIIDDTIKERMKQRFGDRATLTKTLQAQGISPETFRQQQREQIIIEAMSYKFASSEKVLISPHQIEVYYAEHLDDFKVSDHAKLRMIVLKKGPGLESLARQMAEEIRGKVNDGASFAEMASIYSDCQYRAQGGNRGWVDQSHFKKELSDVAFALEAGQCSQVVDLPEACYLLYVDERRPEHIKSLVEVSAEIDAILKARESNRLRSKWIDRLKKKSFVRYRPY